MITNINSSTVTSTYGYKTSTHAKTANQEENQASFKVKIPEDSKDKVSISPAGIHAIDDAVDPPIPEGALPGWLGGYGIRVSTVLGVPQYLLTIEENLKFSNLSSGEQDEYFTLLRSHLHELYERNGLMDEHEKNAALNSKSISEHLRQEFLEGIKTDPRMFELISRLGLPPVTA